MKAPIDYDFVIGRSRLSGSGWRGLLALALFLAFLSSIFVTFSGSTQPVLISLVRLGNGLFR